MGLNIARSFNILFYKVNLGLYGASRPHQKRWTGLDLSGHVQYIHLYKTGIWSHKSGLEWTLRDSAGLAVYGTNYGTEIMAGLNKLTARKVAAHKTPGRIADGGGLYLFTRRNGNKSWVFKRVRNGLGREIGLGALSQVSLAEARNRAERCRALQDNGKDPAFAMKETGDSVTFAQAARQVIDIKKPEWRSGHTLKKWERNLFKYAKPIGNLPVGQIEQGHILKVLRPIWEETNHTAHATRTMIEAVLAYAKVKGWREGDNPAVWKNNLEFMLSKAKPRVAHLAAMPYEDVPAFAQMLQDKIKNQYRGGSPAALLFTILCCVRSKEVRGARWEEFDFRSMTWTVPPERTKGGQVHTIPISSAAAALLEERHSEGLVFPGHRNQPMSDNTLRQVIRRSGDNTTTVHGFRSSFKDWATDVAKVPDEISEMCLGHLVGTAARRAYARSDAIDDRRDLLERWAAHVMGSAH